MLAPWAIEEMKSADLQDKRLNARLTRILSALGERPTASIPAACGGLDEMMAAYRFFDNDKATSDRVLAPHCERTRRRIAAQPVVLLIQDTTEFDFTRPQEQMTGVGPLDGSSRCGAFLHPLVAFTPDGTPLGACAATIWTRDEPSDETVSEKNAVGKQRRSKRKKANAGSRCCERHVKWLAKCRHAVRLHCRQRSGHLRTVYRTTWDARGLADPGMPRPSTR